MAVRLITSEEEARSYIQQGWGTTALVDCTTYVAALRQENERQNLVSSKSLEEAWVRHIADSAQLLEHQPDNCRSWADVGSGAGLPGLIIAILRRDLAVTLIEPRKLRADWLRQTADVLNLGNVRVITARAEDCSNTFDAISARAVAPLHELLVKTQKLGKKGARWIFAKGRNAPAELDKMPVKQRRQWMFHVKHSLTAPDAHIIVCERARDFS